MCNWVYTADRPDSQDSKILVLSGSRADSGNRNAPFADIAVDVSAVVPNSVGMVDMLRVGQDAQAYVWQSLV